MTIPSRFDELQLTPPQAATVVIWHGQRQKASQN
jgi:hypothetical protein